MPHSLKCKIKHLYHNGTITERDCDRILKALDQEPKTDVFDKARVEIAEEHNDYVVKEQYDTAYGLELALGIIDKYKPESEE